MGGLGVVRTAAEAMLRDSCSEPAWQQAASSGHCGGTAQRCGHCSGWQCTQCGPIGGPRAVRRGGGARRACLQSRWQAAEPERGRAVGKNCGEKAPRLMGGANRSGLRVYELADWVEGSCPLDMKVFQNFVFPFPKAQKRN
jgi:hypothetical protein